MRTAPLRSETAIPIASRRLARVTRYVLERFPIPSYGPLIIAVTICGRSAASVASNRSPVLDWTAVATTIGVAAAFLQLRILDDIRDAAADRTGRPDRPLPRGLVTVAELRALALVAAAVGTVVAATAGTTAVVSYIVAIGAIWFCGVDLPRRLPIGHDLLTTALVHSVIAPLVVLYAWTTVAGLAAVAPLAATLVLVWGASLGVEIARKTVAPSEERNGIETYSRAAGRTRAVRLAVAAVSVGCVGAGAFAAATGAPTVLAVAPVVAAVTLSVLARQLGQRIGTTALRSGVVSMVLSALLWPLVVALALA